MTHLNPPSPSDPPTGCRRCGTCCLKGGPALHVEDRPLVAQGEIALRHLYTLRKGELVRDNVAGRLCPASEDIIKIRGQGQSWTCIFFDPAAKSCRIYLKRPLECRILKCWDPRELTARYDHGRLTRRDLISGVAGLWDLVMAHEQEVAYGQIRQLLSTAGPQGLPPDAATDLMAMVHYDASLRAVLVEKGKVKSEHLDFLFGRPLTRTLPLFGVVFHRSDGALSLDYTPAASPLRPF